MVFEVDKKLSEAESKIRLFLTSGNSLRRRNTLSPNPYDDSSVKVALERTSSKIQRRGAKHALWSFKIQAVLVHYFTFLVTTALGLLILIGEEPGSEAEYVMIRLPSTISGLQLCISQFFPRTLILDYVPKRETTLESWVNIMCRFGLVTTSLFIFVTLFTVSYESITQVWLSQFLFFFLLHFISILTILFSPKGKANDTSLNTLTRVMDAVTMKTPEMQNRLNFFTTAAATKKDKKYTRIEEKEKEEVVTMTIEEQAVPALLQEREMPRKQKIEEIFDTVQQSSPDDPQFGLKGGKRDKPSLRPALGTSRNKVIDSKKYSLSSAGFKSGQLGVKF